MPLLRSSAILICATVATMATAAPSVYLVANSTDFSLGVRIAPSSAPERVAGYVPHALMQMRNRNISKADVELVVALHHRTAFLNRQGTWQYTDRHNPNGIIVCLNDDGYVVTAFLRNSS